MIEYSLTFSKDVQGPIIPWILMSFEQIISSAPLEGEQTILLKE